MAKLADFIINDFSGGVVRNKAHGDYQKNEFLWALNMEFGERGRAKRRRGFYQWGTATTGNIVHSISYLNFTLGSAPTNVFLMFDDGANANCYRLFDSPLTTALVDGDTSAVVVGNGDFAAATSTFEVNGDVITYTAVPSATEFTITESTILLGANYPIGSAVHQWSGAVATGMDGESGIYTAILNNVLFVQGRVGAATTVAGASFTAVSDADEPAGLFATTYRDRIYCAGSGAADGSGTRNGSSIRIAWSDLGDSTSWDINNFFDIEDARGEMITGLKNFKDTLLIFKQNGIWTWNEIEVKQRILDVGAYNHRVVQEIGGIIYTFCPGGVYATNGFSAKKISEPIEDILKNFRPRYNTPADKRRVITNVLSFQYDKKYFLYLGDITDPESLQDIILVYDTLKNNWSIWKLPDGTDPQSFTSLQGFLSGDAWQGLEAVFMGDDTGRLFRMFETRMVDSSGNNTGGDIAPDNIRDSAGVAISCILETPLYDFGVPQYMKTFPSVLVNPEQGDFDCSYRLDKGNAITDWKPLGSFWRNEIKNLPKNDNSGKRIALRLGNNQPSTIVSLEQIGILNSETDHKLESNPHG